MHNQNTYESINFDLANSLQLQLPLFYSPQIISNCFGFNFPSNLGVSFLPNVSVPQTQNSPSRSSNEENIMEDLLKCSAQDKKTNWTAEEDAILKKLV